MRIIAGILKGRSLIGPKNIPFRPTLDRVRESIFNVLGDDLIDSIVLDLFCGTGALGIESRLDDEETLERITFLDHKETHYCVAAERSFLQRLEGGCQVPIAAYGIREEDDISLTGLVASVDGKTVIRSSDRGPENDFRNLGRNLAERVLEAGGRQILEEVYCRELN